MKVYSPISILPEKLNLAIVRRHSSIFTSPLKKENLSLKEKASLDLKNMRDTRVSKTIQSKNPIPFLVPGLSKEKRTEFLLGDRPQIVNDIAVAIRFAIAIIVQRHARSVSLRRQKRVAPKNDRCFRWPVIVRIGGNGMSRIDPGNTPDPHNRMTIHTDPTITIRTVRYLCRQGRRDTNSQN